MGSKEETEKLKMKGLNLEKEQVKKQKSSEEATEIETTTKEFLEEKIKEMMQLVPVEDVYVQALQVKHPIIDWKVHSEGQRSYWQIIILGGSSACNQFFVNLLRQLDREDLNQLWALVKEYLSIRPASSDKEIELWVELKRMYEPDPEDQLWTLTQNYMHALVEWKLYDLSRVHHVAAKDKEIFMLVEKDYPLRRGLALVMISYRLQFSTDAAFDEKEPEFKGKKPESEVNVSLSSSAQSKKHDDKTKREAKGKSPVESLTRYRYLSAEFEDFYDNSINEDTATSILVPAIGQNSPYSTNTFSADGPSNAVASGTRRKSSCIDTSQYPDDPNMPELEDITYSDDEDDVGAEADFNNLETSITVSSIPTTRVYKDHHEELLQFKIQKGWVLVDLPHGKRAIEHTQEEGIDYEEVFALVARIEAIRLFLAYASFIGFMVYQIDVKSAFLYGTIEEELYVCQPPGFEDLDYPDTVYKVVKALYGLHQAHRAWQKGDILLVQIYVDDIIFGSTNKDLCKAFEKLMKDKFQMSSMGKLTFFLGLQVKQKKDGIFTSQDKYVAKILRKFRLTDGKSASTPIDTEKPLLKDPNGEDVDVHTYRSMIGSLMYLTSSRPDIMFAVCACARFQVTPKASHLNAVKRIFKYLKGKPHLGLWYPKDSPFDLVAYSDSDYNGASLDRKSTTGGCQFLRCRLISWQCKKQTVIATSSTEAEYVAAASYCA
uniref:Putative ribonuclease H-like domain-containing protein n=1 Tax=Tanacetum cinerariifolium TaxID=118510 RepID=A0A699HK35_TANCI|nr:putative ribonuclease H-like domain-containing protein [Tanacetum cinerariifolium]